MDKKQPKGQAHYIYDHQGESQVSEQIMDAYNSGVIDRKNDAFEYKDHKGMDDTK